jgi:hypothetical protein
MVHSKTMTTAGLFHCYNLDGQQVSYIWGNLIVTLGFSFGSKKEKDCWKYFWLDIVWFQNVRVLVNLLTA